MTNGNQRSADCPLCGAPDVPVRIDRREDFARNISRAHCQRCGVFAFTREAERRLPQRGDAHLLSGVTRRHWEMHGEPLEVRMDNIELYLSQVPNPEDVDSKMRSLLGILARKSKFPGDEVAIDEAADYPLAYAENAQEFTYYLNFLEGLGLAKRFIRASKPTGTITLTPEGWKEAQQAPRHESSKAFVAMKFDDEMQQVFETAIKPSLEEDCGYKAVLINQQEFLEGIVDEIMAEIRESRFIVADVTGQRNGVYFEGGFAMGLGVPVVWTCKQGDVEKLHFDTKHLNHIVWNSPAELRKNLTNRIRATIGKGPLARKSER